MRAVTGSYAPPQPMARSGSYGAIPMVGVSGSYTAAAPPMMAMSGSMTMPMPVPPMYGAPPMVIPQGAMVMPQGLPAAGGSIAAAGAPQKEIPTPDTVAAQKSAYKSALDKQFAQALAQ